MDIVDLFNALNPKTKLNEQFDMHSLLNNWDSEADDSKQTYVED